VTNIFLNTLSDTLIGQICRNHHQ